MRPAPPTQSSGDPGEDRAALTLALPAPSGNARKRRSTSRLDSSGPSYVYSLAPECVGTPRRSNSRMILRIRQIPIIDQTLWPYNAEFSSGRLPTSQEDAWAIRHSPGAHRAESQAPICCNDSLVSKLYESRTGAERTTRSAAPTPGAQTPAMRTPASPPDARRTDSGAPVRPSRCSPGQAPRRASPLPRREPSNINGPAISRCFLAD